MRRLLVGLALGAILLNSAAAQAVAPDSTAQLLRQALQLYEKLEIERALPLLQLALSPQWTPGVTLAQRVDVYTYLAACLVLLGQRDSATVLFRAALDVDPFTDLDPRRFTPEQLALFRNARRLTFRVGARPVSAVRLDPRTERLTFTVVTTHAAALHVEVRSPDVPISRVLYHGESDGWREVLWDGLMADGRLVAPGRYTLLVDARSRLQGRSDSARVYFDISHDLAVLEDTLPDLRPRDLLPEYFTQADATADLAKGLGVATGVALLALLADRRLGSGGASLPVTVAATATVTGVIAFLWRRHHQDAPGHIPENIRREQARHARNEAIRRRNSERTAATVLVVVPASGLGP